VSYIYSLFPFLLIGIAILAGFTAAIRAQGRFSSEETLLHGNPFFPFRYLMLLFGKQTQWEGLLFSLRITQSLFLISYAIVSWILSAHDLSRCALLIALLIVTDIGATVGGKLRPTFSFQLLSTATSFLLALTYLLSLPLFRLIRRLLPPLTSRKRSLPPGFKIRDKVYELLQEAELSTYLDATQQKLILAVVSFKDKIAREVMVPRIRVLSLSDDTLLADAAKTFLSEGYSRIPVYHESVDNIIGVLLHKDVLQLYVEHARAPEGLNTTIRPLVKPALYTPETKKISHLLQEFRHKQIHLAIVVDEWGGTEGIVTIEDILEELVGEIADEYDTGGEELFSPLPDGSWILDAKMSILDVREELGINIPQSPEYDTIGGYVFNKAGAIPSKGWKIHHDNFNLEVLSSSDRAVDKIRISALL
jgi:CBS domain containing-hemolysin-like protein